MALLESAVGIPSVVRAREDKRGTTGGDRGVTNGRGGSPGPHGQPKYSGEAMTWSLR